jgi:hypothetical protein
MGSVVGAVQDGRGEWGLTFDASGGEKGVRRYVVDGEDCAAADEEPGDAGATLLEGDEVVDGYGVEVFGRHDSDVDEELDGGGSASVEFVGDVVEGEAVVFGDAVVALVPVFVHGHELSVGCCGLGHSLLRVRMKGRWQSLQTIVPSWRNARRLSGMCSLVEVLVTREAPMFM